MRETIIEIALSLSITVFEEAVIREQEILNADEIFLTNAIEGIKWVVAYKNKRYFNKITKKIYQELLKLTM
jgi:branched-chain amino acid aminotransferase